jgi:hypothetical protein
MEGAHLFADRSQGESKLYHFSSNEIHSDLLSRMHNELSDRYSKSPPEKWRPKEDDETRPVFIRKSALHTGQEAAVDITKDKVVEQGYFYTLYYPPPLNEENYILYSLADSEGRTLVPVTHWHIASTKSYGGADLVATAKESPNHWLAFFPQYAHCDAAIVLLHYLH